MQNIDQMATILHQAHSAYLFKVSPITFSMTYSQIQKYTTIALNILELTKVNRIK